MDKNKIRAIIISVILATLIIPAQAAVLKLDLKTKNPGKSSLSLLKTGAHFYLAKDGYRIVSKGEKYLVWIDNASEITQGDIVTVHVTIRLTSVSANAKTSLTRTVVAYSYSLKNPVSTLPKDGFAANFHKQMRRASPIQIAQAQMGGKAIAEAVDSIIKNKRL